MSYDLEASVKKLRGMIKIIHFFLDEKTNQKNQVYAYKSVNNGYSLNALEHSHMKCEHKSFLTLTTPN